MVGTIEPTHSFHFLWKTQQTTISIPKNGTSCTVVCCCCCCFWGGWVMSDFLGYLKSRSGQVLVLLFRNTFTGRLRSPQRIRPNMHFSSKLRTAAARHWGSTTRCLLPIPLATGTPRVSLWLGSIEDEMRRLTGTTCWCLKGMTWNDPSLYLTVESSLITLHICIEQTSSDLGDGHWIYRGSQKVPQKQLQTPVFVEGSCPIYRVEDGSRSWSVARRALKSRLVGTSSRWRLLD